MDYLKGERSPFGLFRISSRYFLSGPCVVACLSSEAKVSSTSLARAVTSSDTGAGFGTEGFGAGLGEAGGVSGTSDDNA